MEQQRQVRLEGMHVTPIKGNNWPNPAKPAKRAGPGDQITGYAYRVHPPKSRNPWPLKLQERERESQLQQRREHEHLAGWGEYIPLTWYFSLALSSSTCSACSESFLGRTSASISIHWMCLLLSRQAHTKGVFFWKWPWPRTDPSWSTGSKQCMLSVMISLHNNNTRC